MKKWRFVSNQNSTIVGINDAGIETFTANVHRSLVREIIQNSLDAALPNTDEPVEVEFVLFDLSRDKLPDVDKLQNVMEQCKISNSNEPDAKRFFEEAERILKQPTLKVLRISDHKTIGLEGSGTCEKGTGWSRLVKENGSSNKGQSSGGSFGIGKSAAFACSDLRTVFYSSLDSTGLQSNIGVARLVSFKDKNTGGWTTGTGYFSEDEKFVAIPEMASFDEEYVRTDSGTDIYIMGMHLTANTKKTFIATVLLDFLVSLVKGKLIVNVQGDIIDKSSLHKYIAELNPYDGDEIRDLVAYHHLLTSRDPMIKKIPLDAGKYGQKFGFKDGECTLYLQETERANRKIMITRCAGMRIYEQDHISGSIEFTGVLIIDGPNMNETFKKMEVPSHDAWEPGRCRGEEKKYNNILKGLRKYLRDTVKDCFGKVTSNSMDAIGASDFLPDKSEDEQENRLQKNDLSTRINKMIGKSVEPTKARSRVTDIVEAGLQEEGEGKRGTKGSNRKSKGKGSNTSGDEKGYRFIPVRKRLMCSDVSKGSYVLSLVVPTTASVGKLEFILSGEQSDFELPVNSAKILTPGIGTSIESYDKNKLYLKNMKKGQLLKMEVQVDFDGYCMMEVDYYENKK